MALFMQNTFTLLERNQIRRAFASKNLEPHNCRSSKCIKSIGSMLSSRFIITGTLEKNEGYTLFARVHLMPEGLVVNSYQQEFTGEEDRRPAIKILADKITRDILNFNKKPAPPVKPSLNNPPAEKEVTKKKPEKTSVRFPMNFSIDWVMVFPAGKFNELVNKGYGFHCSLEVFPLRNLSIPLTKYLFFGIRSGYQVFQGKVNEDDRITLLPILGVTGLQYPLTGRINLRLSLSGGATRVSLSHKSGDGFSMPDNTSRSSMEGTFSTSAGGGFRISQQLILFTEWFYSMRFEEKNPIHSTGFSIMATLNFSL